MGNYTLDSPRPWLALAVFCLVYGAVDFCVEHHAEQTHLSSNLTVGAVAAFDPKTTPCVASRRFFFLDTSWPFASKHTDPQSVLRDDKESACFEGASGVVLIELSKPILLRKVHFAFDKKAGKSIPRDAAIYGFEDKNNNTDSTMTVVRFKADATEQQFSYKQGGKKRPVKFLNIVVLTNWGAPKTTIKSIKLSGKQLT